MKGIETQEKGSLARCRLKVTVGETFEVEPGPDLVLNDVDFDCATSLILGNR
jgi:hypothetical protein